MSLLLTQLYGAGFATVTTEPYAVREDLQDHFLYSHKHRPAEYLRPEVRAGASGFRLLTTPEELTRGLAQLEADLASGRIDQVVTDTLRQTRDLGDYLFVVATTDARDCSLVVRFRLATWNTEGAPRNATERLGKQDNLPDMVAVVRELTVHSFDHQHRLTLNSDGAL